MNALKALVAIMGALIIVLMTVMGYGLYQKATNPEFSFFDLGGKQANPLPVPADTTPAPTKELSAQAEITVKRLGLPASTQVRDIEATNGYLFIHVRMPDGTERILTLDGSSGRVAGTIDINR